MVTIEPIKNQYLTALKERQQIIDKLNEIISGLNALNFDDLTTIQAELVAIRESLQTQNTAITEINKSIGQIESELTSFDNRLITLNTNINDTKAHLTEFENDTTLNLQTKVNKNGDTMTGNLGIPTTITGARDSFAVNGERLQNDLDNYSQMLRTTGNQKKVGILTQTNTYGQSIQESTGYRVSDTTDTTNTFVSNRVLDANGEYIYSLSYGRRSDGSKLLRLSLNNLLSDETYKQSTLIINNYKDGSASLVLEDSKGRQITIGRTET